MFYNLSMMKKLPYLLLLLLLTGCAPESDFEKYKEHVKTLASDEFEGRKPGTPGGETKTILRTTSSLGLSSFGGSYLMPVNLTGINLMVDESYFNLSVNGQKLDLDYRTDFVYGTTRQTKEVAFEDSGLVFVATG